MEGSIQPDSRFTPLPSAANGGKLIPDAFADGMAGIAGPSPNAGKEVANIQLVGSLVDAPVARNFGALHLNEMITYKDGAVDVVGYFPPPSSQTTISESAPLYANRVSARSFEALPENVRHDVLDGQSRYSLNVRPIPGQSLTQTAEAQDRQWQNYNRNPLPYDAIGEVYHNSNGAMNASFSAVGRRDISQRLERDLSSVPEHELQRDRESAEALGTTPDRVELAEVVLRTRRHLPTAPGVSNPPTAAEIAGAGERNIGHALSSQAFMSSAVSAASGALGAGIERIERFPAEVKQKVEGGFDRFIDDRIRDGLRKNGVSTIAPWNGSTREGRIVHSDENIAVQAIGRGIGVVYDVREHLGGVSPPVGQYLSVGQDGITALQQKPAYDLGRG